ncbi:EAL domain-containing protein [Oxalobacter sp. OttesenSCG-928-P03]|nr:EAL domain-containing protein [Oxalobacter sp. OttesenSCG-928-P03]
MIRNQKTGSEKAGIKIDHAQILENLPIVTMRLSYEDNRWKTWYVSKNIERYGYAWKDLIDNRISWLDIVHPDDRIVIQKLSHDYMERRLDAFRLQYRVLTPHGESIWITEYSHINRDENGNPYCIDSALLNYTEAKLGEETIASHVRQQMVLNDILLSLHDANLENALQIILDRAGAYLDCSRVLLFKDSPDHVTCKVEYEWLNKGITSIKELDYAITYETAMPEIYIALQDTGILLVNAGEIPDNCKEEFEHEGLLASAIFAVYLHGDHYGFICFDDCVIERRWDDDTASFLKNISNLISTVLMRMHTEEQLKMTQKTCETVLDNVDSYIFAIHPQTSEIIFANTAFREVFGDECIGKNSEDYLPVKAFMPIRAPERKEVVSSDELTEYETYLPETNQWLVATKELVNWVDGQTAYLVNCHDITAKKHYEEGIERLAYLDHLTGLPNRYRCDVDLEASLEKVRKTGQPGYVFFIDLDDFKVVNDSYGHDYGDEVLRSFASYLKTLYSAENYHVFRFGGDEFVIILDEMDETKATAFLDAMMERAKRPWSSKDREFYCSLSIGIMPITAGETEDVKSVLKKADIAMYHAKQQGKNNYFYYSEGMDDAVIQRSEMEALLRQGMENEFQGFEVYYQPVCDTKNQKIVGAEALIRMRDAEGNLVLPQHFIPLAEYLGLIVPLGEHIIREAAQRCREINEAGEPDFHMTINLSAKQFSQKDIISRIEHLLRSTGVRLENIIIAINEGVALGELERMLQLCSGLRRQGIRVALDDFGSGSASFINMRDLPVDIIKVSSVYVDAIEDEFTGYFVRLVTDLGHFSGKMICMNGVETQEQFAFCQRMKVDMVQGFLFYRPDSIRSLEAILQLPGTNTR